MAPSRSQRLRRTSLPYPYRDRGLDLFIDQYRVDDEEPVRPQLAAGERTIDISGLDANSWDRLVLRGSITVPESVIDSVFAGDERSNPPGRLYVAIRCRETIFRDRTVAETDNGQIEGAGTYEVEIELAAGNLRGEVVVRPYLTRSMDAAETESQFATTAGVRLASGDPWRVVVDSEHDSEGQMIDGEEASFSNQDFLPGEERIYYLDLRNADRPKLWLNNDHPRIVDVLRAEGSVGAEARMRDVVLDQIQRGVWSQLIVRAIADSDENGEPLHEWEQTVLEIFAPKLTGRNDVAEATINLRNELEDPKDSAELVGTIDDVLQDHLDPREQLIDLMEEGLRL